MKELIFRRLRLSVSIFKENLIKYLCKQGAGVAFSKAKLNIPNPINGILCFILFVYSFISV